MDKPPWDKKILKKGQIIQRLEHLHCKEIEQHTPTSAMWKTPTGHIFSISYENCAGEHLQGIVDQIEKWVEDSNKNRL